MNKVKVGLPAYRVDWDLSCSSNESTFQDSRRNVVKHVVDDNIASETLFKMR